MKDISKQDQEQKIPLATKKSDDHKTIVKVKGAEFGGDKFVVIAGPCTVEQQDQIIEIAKAVKERGATVLRGGAFKPLTIPYRSNSFFELGFDGLKFLSEAGKETGLPVVSEIVDVRHVEKAAPYLDLIQVGARNMQNFPLLEEIAKTKKPVILKRHFGCSLRDLLGAAEYLLYGGNTNVILCERGVVAPHTHQVTSRFIIDIQAIPAAKEFTHLPIIVDPSHSTFKRSYVAPVSKAAMAVGADGLIIDVHPTPETAAVDPLQGLNYAAFAQLTEDLEKIGQAVNRPLNRIKEVEAHV